MELRVAIIINSDINRQSTVIDSKNVRGVARITGST